jgi:predicted RNA binding protein YcfA (HicA-like mRNA interferase family)
MRWSQNMTRAKKTLSKLQSGTRSVRFVEFEQVLLAFGFVHRRTSGSHRIYSHPKATRPLSIQPINGEAKAYQVKQFLAMVAEFGL